jgi:hypothetical protein
VAPASLRFLYSFLYSEHINHIQIFGCTVPPVHGLLYMASCTCHIILLYLF